MSNIKKNLSMITRTSLTGLFCLFMSFPTLAKESQQIFEAGLSAFRSGDTSAALSHWQVAASMGNENASFNLGLLYAKGQGVKQDWETAHALFIEASRLNHNLATFSLAIMYLKGQGVQPNLTTAYLWANLAANRNHETSRKLRDDIAKRLTPDQLIDANKIVHNCGPRTVDPEQFDSYVACISENR